MNNKHFELVLILFLLLSMNSSEALISAFHGENKINTEHHTDVLQFMNANEEYALQQKDNIEQNDYFETREVELTIAD